MRAGELDRRVTIRRETVEQDPYGEEIATWSDLATVWASVRQEGGKEFFAAAATTAERKVIFRLHWIDGLTVMDQVRYDGRDHNIHEVRELGRRVGLELHTVASG